MGGAAQLMGSTRGRFGGVDLLQLGEQLGADHLGNRHPTAHVADGVLDDIGRRLLAVVDLFAIKIDLEPTLPYGRKGDADFAILPSANLSCHTGSLPEIPSRNAVLDLQVNFTFSHSRPPGLSLVLNHQYSSG